MVCLSNTSRRTSLSFNSNSKRFANAFSYSGSCAILSTNLYANAFVGLKLYKLSTVVANCSVVNFLDAATSPERLPHISFNNKLSELITRWADKEELAEVGYYQKQFIYHGGVIEDLLESIAQKEIRTSALNNSDNLIEDSNLSEKHIELRKRMEKQREIYAELKKNIFRFLE